MKQHTWCKPCRMWHTQGGRAQAHPQPKPEPTIADRLATDPEFREEFARKLEEQG